MPCIMFIKLMYHDVSCLSNKVYGGFLKWGYPQIVNSNGMFHHKTSILGILLFKKPQYVLLRNHSD